MTTNNPEVDAADSANTADRSPASAQPANSASGGNKVNGAAPGKTRSQGPRAEGLNADQELDQELRSESWTVTGADVDPSPANDMDEPAPEGHAETAGRRDAGK